MKKPKQYYEYPLVDQEAFFDTAFQKELEDLLKTLDDSEEPERVQLIFKLFRSRYRLIPRW